ncbi:hypothetical protein I2494_02510 [Budviciaceae bacterium BWR-B9]|uniref:Chain length determinant protein n=1 Tax=Limnobaculum allomyrinae TaxID=2791986 RepID=A0ABS1IM36_9GAMM|nr:MULTISPECIES: Wzz/FepE/Etk N-terminal domain-containing protein [Limnobaculum]MBK5142606.1 hypothetical protein [Limnobaculum allomyrinae]MBV7690508.1 hypothetical protein [Limnobaculum sp. M2-1]
MKSIFADNNNPQTLGYRPSHSDEIDLIDLLMQLWQGRWWIITLTAVAFSLGLAYVMVVKEQWNAKSYLTAPRIAEFGAYLEQRRAFALVLGLNETPTDMSQRLFNHFTALALSPNEKYTYLLNTNYFRQETEGMTEVEQRLWLEHMAEKELVISSPDERRQLPYFILEAKADSSETAKALMEGYLTFINHRVLQREDTEFRNSITALVNVRQKELSDIEFSLQTQHENQLTELTRALETARQAGIKDYYTSAADNGNTKIELTNSVHKYMLGENFLSAEINGLKSNPLVYPVRYYDIQREIQLLAPLLIQTLPEQTYSYQRTLDASVKKQRPKVIHILALCILVGGMIGIGAVVCREVLINYRRRCSLMNS